MAKRQFKAESKRLLDLMIHSIYTHKEIFLRELISNASDAIDKIYYKALTDDSISFNKDDYFIKIGVNKATRTLTISDTGIGMTDEELADNLGVIANSGTFKFKEGIEKAEDYDIIGQFGVGFYSAFMVASKVTVTTKALGSDKAFKWVSTGAEGYTISEAEKDSVGTDIEIIVKENSDEENYDDYLDTYRLQMIIKKYSDFIRYPIKMDVTKSIPVEGKEGEYTEEIEEKTVNSMVPIWRKNKTELSDEDYETFYQEKHYGYDKPARYLHIKAEGASTRYAAILYIPKQMPYDFYTKEFEKGLELYANGVMIMKKCGDLLPDYFSFVQGMVDSEDLSLNISREMLQHDRQLKVIAKNIKSKIKGELEKMMSDDREGYDEFFKAFGRQLKYGVYDSFGMNKEDLQGLLMFYSSTEEKLVSLTEYVGRMKEDQKYIYYASGESVEKIKLLPQTERVADAGFEILYFTEDIDEFAINVLSEYEGKTFKNVNSGDLGIEEKEDDKPAEEKEENQKLFDAMQSILGEKVTKVKASNRLASTAVCLSTEGGITIEMEKILASMPNNDGAKAERVLEINTEHAVFEALKKAKASNEEKFGLYTELLYNQAVLMEGLSVDNPVEFSKDICKLIK